MPKVFLKSTLVVVIFSVLSEGIVVLDGKVGEPEKFTINRDNILGISYPHSNSTNPYRVHVWSSDATADLPVLVVVRQQRDVMSWEVPFLVEDPSGPIRHENTSRTLCYDSADDMEIYRKGTTHKLTKKPDDQRNFTLSLSTSSEDPVTVFALVEEVLDFLIETDRQYKTLFSPSEPVYFSYNFPEAAVEPSNKDFENVLIRVASSDETCFVVSVQPQLCPVRDLNDDIYFEGKYQTVNTKGGLTISRKAFGDGFYLVFVAMGTNYACSQKNSMQPKEPKVYSSNQTSMITFRVQTGLTSKDYSAAIGIVLGACLGACLLFALVTLLFYRFGNHRWVQQVEEEVALRVVHHEEDATDNEHVYATVADFAKKGLRNNKKARNYIYHTINIAIFYGVPVVQLMVSYQRVVDTSGNLDICYHNTYCSHPYYFTDFNHIYSNIGYALFGFLFLIITRFRNLKMKNVRGCGIPELYGLYYAMALALVFEGVLSACYHICPNQSNFQFDTSFMYAMAILIMVKLYQNRHPDINASAYTTFSVLGVAVFITMCGVLHGSLAVMIIFILCYIILCIYMASRVYFFRGVLVGWEKVFNRYKNKSGFEVMKPTRLGTFILVVLASFVNVAIAVAGVVLYPSRLDFGTFVLGILMLNAIMYTVFYTIMKWICKETVCMEAKMYGALSLVFWGFGSSFFKDAATMWSVTPAESRQLNQECILLGFYDTHDIWHLLSAPALFFSFMFIQTLDDDLFDKAQNTIDAF